MDNVPRKADGRRVFSPDFKQATVQRILTGEKTVAEVSRELDIAPSVIRNWKRHYEAGGTTAVAANDEVVYAHELGLVPITTPAYSPQSNGLAEAFVKTFKRDYVDGAELRDAESVLAQLGGWVEDYNTRAPHSALGMRSPAEYRAEAPLSSSGEQHNGEHSSAVCGEGYHIDEAGGILERYPTERFDFDQLEETCLRIGRLARFGYVRGGRLGRILDGSQRTGKARLPAAGMLSVVLPALRIQMAIW